MRDALEEARALFILAHRLLVDLRAAARCRCAGPPCSFSDARYANFAECRRILLARSTVDFAVTFRRRRRGVTVRRTPKRDDPDTTGADCGQLAVTANSKKMMTMRHA